MSGFKTLIETNSEEASTLSLKSSSSNINIWWRKCIAEKVMKYKKPSPGKTLETRGYVANAFILDST
jgi:hypothetical protein